MCVGLTDKISCNHVASSTFGTIFVPQYMICTVDYLNPAFGAVTLLRRLGAPSRKLTACRSIFALSLPQRLVGVGAAMIDSSSLAGNLPSGLAARHAGYKTMNDPFRGFRNGQPQRQRR